MIALLRLTTEAGNWRGKMKSSKPAERPKAVEVLAAITEIAMQFRTGPEQSPTLQRDCEDHRDRPAVCCG